MRVSTWRPNSLHATSDLTGGSPKKAAAQNGKERWVQVSMAKKLIGKAFEQIIGETILYMVGIADTRKPLLKTLFTMSL